MKEKEKTLSDFPIPSSEKIERQFLADIVGCSYMVGEMTGLISEEMFTSDIRKRIWERIVEMSNVGDTIDYASIVSKIGPEAIKELISLETIGGATPTSVTTHAKLLRDTAARRKTYFAAIGLLEASTRAENTEESLFEAADSVARQLQMSARTDGESNICDVINRIADDIQRRKDKKDEDRIPTGFPTLDSLTYRGWGAGQLIILAARPSVGKTAVMLQMAKASSMAGFPSVIFSLEMTERELGNRLLFSTDIVSPQQVSSGDMNWNDFEDASSRISSLPLLINDKSRVLQKITSKILILSQRGLCRVAFIDYLGLIKDTESSRLPLYQQISNITGALKATAKQAGVPIILLCQLNRDAAKDGRPPQLYDLRDSGSIEQDADIVLMLEGVQSILDNTTHVNMWVRKNRQYRKEICIQLRPNGTYSNFEETGVKE